jgi:hypothetical protein
MTNGEEGELPVLNHIKGENRERSKLGKGQHSAVDVGGGGGGGGMIL